MKKYCCLSLLIIAAAAFKAQSFKKGDLIVSVGYGMPNIAAWSEQKSFGGSVDESLYTSTVNYSKNTGILSARVEYAVSNKLSLGLSSGFWQMDIDHFFSYSELSMINPGSRHAEKYKYHLSSTSIAARANYHFWKNNVIDAYAGIGIGITKHGYDYQYFPQSPGIAASPRGFINGIGPCVAASLGLKYYFCPGIGLSFEVGYDTGAMFLGGIAFRLRNKKNGDLK